MTAEIKTIHFIEGLPVSPPDTTLPMSVGIPVNPDHAVRLDMMNGSNGLIASGEFVDAVTTGIDATILTPTKTIHTLTNNSLESIQSIDFVSGAMIVLQNKTGAKITLKNLSGNIDTGLGVDLELQNRQAMILIASPSDSVWRVAGGSGGSGGGALTWGPTTQTITNGGKVSLVGLTSQVLGIKLDSASDVNLDLDLFDIPPNANGTIIHLLNVGAFVIKLSYSNANGGAMLKGDNYLESGSMQKLIWDSVANRYWDGGRNV